MDTSQVVDSVDVRDVAFVLSPTSPPELRPVPQDVIDYTVDFLFNDRDSLKQCSLVCRAWQPRVNLHLFQSFSWPPCRHAWREHFNLRTPCICTTLDGPAFCDELLALVEHSPRLQASVLTLRVSFQRTIASASGDTRRFAHDIDRKSTRLNSSHSGESRMPSSA